MDVGDRSVRGGYDDKMIMNQIMLRFRPIAPKPAVDGGSASSYSNPENKKKDTDLKKRAKRKYVRVKKSCVRTDNKNKAKESTEDWIRETVVTLELLPEIGKRYEEGGISKDLDFSGLVQPLPSLLSLNMAGNNFHASDLMVVESWVTVECVTDTWSELDGRLGYTEEEKVRNLKADTCPGFVSDGVDGVRWVNLAYRRLVDPRGGGGEPPEVVVWLEAKEKFPVGKSAFSCRVRVVYGGGSGKVAVVLPCDVWRMEFGGFAWRLDVQAALSLGR